jgi:hypothetical protein
MLETDPVPLRVYSEADGKVYLLREPQNWRVEVETPVTEQSLDKAFRKLAEVAEKENRNSRVAREGENEASATPQQLANRQIKTTINPPPVGFIRFVARVGLSIGKGVLLVFVMLLTVSVINWGVQASRDNLPEALHLVVLLLYAVGLAFCIYLMATDEIRKREIPRIEFLFGPNGLILLPFLTLVVAASVFASLTLTLYNHGWVVLQPCPGVGRTVSPGALLDFYVWHFFKLVPFLKLNETLKWGEPLCYTQARVGFFILLFQGLVVLPSINTVRFFWRNRQNLKAKPYKYIYEPGWRPESDLEA